MFSLLRCALVPLLALTGCDRPQQAPGPAATAIPKPSAGSQSHPAPSSRSELNPRFPVASGARQLTKSWWARYPVPLNSRIEAGNLVLWRSGLTLFVATWDNPKGESREERLNWIRSDVSTNAFDSKTKRDGELIRFSYRLEERSGDSRRPALYAFVIADHGHVQVAAYFDAETDLKVAESFVSGLTTNQLAKTSP